MLSVPISLIEFFLAGRASPDELQRFTQDAGIVADVWLSFAQEIGSPRRVLLAPVDGLSAIATAGVLHEALRLYRTTPAVGKDAAASGDDALRKGIPVSRAWPNVAPLENFVAATIYFDELVRVVLPLTDWWRKKDMSLVQDVEAGDAARQALETAIIIRLGASSRTVASVRQTLTQGGTSNVDRQGPRLLEASPIATLIGVFALAAGSPSDVPPFPPQNPEREAAIRTWAIDKAATIAQAAGLELARPTEQGVISASADLERDDRSLPDGLIQRVFLDRPSQLADTGAVATVKADAADRLFRISCKSLTWAIVDSGIDSRHPAFDEFKVQREGTSLRTHRSRVRATYDLTLIDRIRNFDLTVADPTERAIVIDDIIRDLKALPGNRPTNFDQIAEERLTLIAAQLRERLMPDWGLIEPLIQIVQAGGAGLASDHGTHVAGILAGDWRTPTDAERPSPDDLILQGICPDISIYDLRVIHPKKDFKNTEFAIIAALEFVRYLNSRAAGPPVIHGVNISLSIPHDVRNYGCGATPICGACDDLVQSGVVVVAAAGNRGWNEQEVGFGNFVFCSITDPGNAQNVITVGATHRLKPHSYGVSYFSSRGPTGDGRMKPDLVAPGEKIRGPIRGDADDELDGTSMAAPFVSGAAAMLMARNRELIRQPLKIKAVLCKTATDLGRERYFQGHGLVDVLRALQSL